jgi:SAM-dependent methyltransferase
LEEGAYDLGYAATSFHWLDPELALPRIKAALKPGGWFATWWNIYGDPDAEDPFRAATDGVFNALGHQPSWLRGGKTYGLATETRIAELAGAGFTDIRRETFSRTIHLDSVAITALYATFSPIAREAPQRRAQLLDTIRTVARDQFGDRVERLILTPVYFARKP